MPLRLRNVVFGAAALALAACASIGQVKISQVCGAGGLNDSCPNFDFVELHNTGAAPADLSGWSLQLGAGSAAAWTVLPFPAGLLIPAHGYVLVQCERTLAVGTPPEAAPDVVFPASPIFSSGGRVVLLSTQLPLTGADPRADALRGSVRDFLGYGASGAAEGRLAPAPGAGPPCRMLVRACAGELDTGDNLADFVVTDYAPGLPRSSSSPPPTVTPEITSVHAAPAGAQAGESITLSASLAPCYTGAATVTADLSPIDGPVDLQLFDDGTQGDQVAGDRIFSRRFNVPATAPALRTIRITAVDALDRTDSATLSIAVEPPILPVRISQAYGGGGTSAAGFNSDFIEIHNDSTQTIDLAGYGVIFAAPLSSTWNRVDLSGPMAPKSYALVQLHTPALPVGGPLPPADFNAATSPFVSGGGKIALVASPLTPSTGCPGPGDRVVDLVGAGLADCREGASADDNAPWGGFTPTAIVRRCDGENDSDNNAADWFLARAHPRNAESAPASGLLLDQASAAPDQPVLPGSPVTLTAIFAQCDGAPPPGGALTADLSAIGGSPTAALFDDGTHGDAIAGDNAYSLATTIAPLTPPGDAAIAILGRDALGRSIAASVTIRVLMPPLGSCCSGPACDVGTQAQCDAAGGRWLGAATACRALSPRSASADYTGAPRLPNILVDLANERFPFGVRGSGVVIGPRGLRVVIRIDHTWVGDLTIGLTNGVNVVTLIDRVGRTGPGNPGSAADLHGEYVFDDTADLDIWSAAAAAGFNGTVPPGEYRPAAPLNGGPPDAGLSVFAGQSLDGTWTLTIVDSGVGDTGYLNAFTLIDNRVRSACCPADFNVDGLLDPDDLADLVACFFQIPPCGEADLNGDGVINPDDLSDGIGEYFTGCP